MTDVIRHDEVSTSLLCFFCFFCAQISDWRKRERKKEEIPPPMPEERGGR